MKSFRMFTGQLAANGNCKQMDIVRALGAPYTTVKRAVKPYREKGPVGSYEKKKKIGNSRVLTSEVLEKAQSMFDNGAGRGEETERLDIKIDTLF